MTPKDLRQALPLFHDFLDRFAPLVVDDKRTESRHERLDAYLRGLLLDAESTMVRVDERSNRPATV